MHVLAKIVAAMRHRAGTVHTKKQTQKREAKNIAKGFKKVCKEVVLKNGAASRS